MAVGGVGGSGGGVSSDDGVDAVFLDVLRPSYHSVNFGDVQR